MSNRTGYLTIYSPDRTEIYGEFADAEWTSEMTSGGNNNVFSGIASESTMETFQQLDSDAISHVSYTFESDGHAYSGNAELLAPITGDLADQPQIRIETGDIPKESSPALNVTP